MIKNFILLAGFIYPVFLFGQETEEEIFRDSTLKDRFYTFGYEIGSVFFKDGSIKQGLIKFNGNVFFKENGTGKRQKFNEDILNGFEITQDTFIVGRALYYTSKQFFIKDKSFLKRIRNGDAQLYEMRYTKASPGMYGGSYTVTNYYVRKGFEYSFTLIPTSKKKFRETMSSYFSKDKELSQKILNGKYGFDDLELIIDIYNKKVSF